MRAAREVQRENDKKPVEFKRRTEERIEAAVDGNDDEKEMEQ